MSTSTPESRELLRLYKCVVETGTGVLTAFAQNKLLAAYNGNIKQFLDDKKHELFHLWQSKKLSCCGCPPAGYNFKRMSHMDNWIFKKLYAGNGPENRSHILRNGRDVVQVCLHKYVTQNIAIHELDISAISFLLRNLIILSANETTTLDIITTTRSKICHAYSIKCYPMTLLNTTWTELENALVDLADPSYKVIIRQQIKYLRKVDLEKEEITKLISNVEEVLQEVKSSSNNNVAYLHGMETRLINKSIRNTDAIKRHTTEETNYYAAQAQKALSEKIQNTEENLQKEVKEVKKSQENSYQKIGTELHETRSGIKELKENQEKTQVTLVEMSRTIKNLEMLVKYERPNVLVPEEACSDAMECPVLWQIATPEHWNLEAVEATLRSPSQKDESFKIKFVKKGSLIMLTTIAASVLGDSKAFEAAVMSFLTKMIEDCGINTEIPGRVDVRLHILNANEVSISCELPRRVRHEQTSGIKKEITESVTIDVAFLNGDDIKEIQWVQNVSKKLKTKFDVNCAILSKDYLNGFPLRKSLGQYVHMFKAVIVTITKENHELYDYFIEDNMSVIAVELDYINEVRLNLRKCQHINCTTCEHLWFPRLMNILKTMFPDHIRQHIENYTDEVDVNCEKCMQSATTAVYHGIELRKEFNEKRLILCGSLTDESWILNFLYQITNFTEPYRITTWIKSIGTPCQFTSNTIFVLDSPNLIKCKQINDYSDYCRFTTSTLRTVIIAPSEMPFCDGSPEYYIDATSMNYKELADELFVCTRSKYTSCTSKA
ncbi:uncharacterized protein [Mytilus edulis]|uniref:uncharacterized protein n=1 Tax=Mytilus edulis TaxID=6550 RepID=UPI0039EE25B8